MARKAWYVYKNGFNMYKVEGKNNAFTALEQEAKRSFSSTSFGDVAKGDSIAMKPLFPGDNLFEAKFEEIK